MGAPDDQFEFEFFDEDPATTEAPARPRLPRRGGSGVRPPRDPGASARSQLLLRRVGLALVVLVVLILFGVGIQSCSATSAHDRYRDYMRAVQTIVASSAADGKAVEAALTVPGIKVPALQQKLAGIAAQERQNAAAAARLDAPGRLRPENVQLVEALQLRVSGTQGLADTFGATADSKAASDAALLLAQAQRLLASDIVYSDLFLEPSKSVMQQNGVVGVQVPASQYLGNPQLATESYWTLVLQRLRGSAASGSSSSAGLVHGTNIVSTVALPGNVNLSQQTENTVVARTNLEFDVTVHNGGQAQEVGIPVTLTIQQTSGSIVKTQQIAVIDPNADATVRFKNLGVVQFAQKETIVVDVAAVPHEHDTTNNHATYPVIFSLG